MFFYKVKEFEVLRGGIADSYVAQVKLKKDEEIVKKQRFKNKRAPSGALLFYSHSIVAGGFDEIS